MQATTVSLTKRPAIKAGAMLVMPAGIWLASFMLLPLAIIFVFSLGYRDAVGHIHLGLRPDNYLRFFTGPYLISLTRSLALAGATTVFCLFLSFPVASWLAFSVPRRRQNLFMTLLTVPLWTSFLLRIYAWIVILRPTGLIATSLSSLGFSHVPQMLYNPPAVLLGMLYNYLPYMILPLYTALEKLDRRLLEASHDLGAGFWATLTRVTLPLSTRGIIAGVIMVFVPSLGDYVTPDLMGGAKTMYIGSLIQNQFLSVRDWAFGSAVSTILLVLVGAGIYVYLKYVEPDVPRV